MTEQDITQKSCKGLQSYILQEIHGLYKSLKKMKTADKKIYLCLKNREGSVEHYFHFLLGFLIPLSLEHKKIIDTDKNTKIFIRSCNIMDRHILDIDFKNIELVEKNILAEQKDYIERWGYDNPEHYDHKAFNSARVYLSKHLFREIESYNYIFENNKDSKKSKHIVIINRSAPHPFYASEKSEIKGAGASRRSISNFGELSDAVSSKYENTLSLTLENKSLSYQMALFRYADIIVAQHGAALANLIWCRPETTLIEICPVDLPQNVYNKNYFGNLAKCMNIEYIRINQKHKHSDVDVKSILTAIETS